MKLSQGEIADRITILEIKLEKIGNCVAGELAELRQEWKGGFEAEVNALRRINRRAWDCVDMIYAGFLTDFGSDDWRLSDIDQAEKSIKNFRLAHMLNMERIGIKNAINKDIGYQEYKTWKSSTI